MISGSSKSLLIVDDDSDFRETLEIVLQLNGYTVTAVPDASQAWSWLRSTSSLPCVILLDFMMPDMNGVEFFVQLTSDTALAEIPIIFITGADSALDKSILTPTTRVLRKPFDIEQLLTLVQEFNPPSGSG